MGPQNGPKMHQNLAPEAPKTLLEPGCRWKLVSEPFLVLFGTLGTPKIVLSLWRGAIFVNFASRAREPETAPQMVPTSSLKRPPEAPEWPKTSLQIGARILIKFQVRFCRFWTSKMTTKIIQKSASEPRALGGTELLLVCCWCSFSLASSPPLLAF